MGQMTDSLMDGGRLALVIGFSLALVNGVFGRFSPSRRTLQQIVNNWVSPTRGGV